MPASGQARQRRSDVQPTARLEAGHRASARPASPATAERRQTCNGTAKASRPAQRPRQPAKATDGRQANEAASEGRQGQRQRRKPSQRRCGSAATATRSAAERTQHNAAIRPPASAPAVCFWAPVPMLRASLRPGRATACAAASVCLLLGVAARPRPLPTKARSGCRTSRRRTSSSIYYDSLGYLVPHAVRTFTNSLAWQRRMFGWVPSEPTTVLLKDLADYGSAARTRRRATCSSSTSRRCRTRSRRSRPPSACTR